MGRLLLHRFERDEGWLRFVCLSLTVLLFGFLGSILTWLVAAESCAGIAAPLFQSGPSDWSAESWSRALPVLVALAAIPALAGLAIGAHAPAHGGFLAFLVSLFDALPLLSGAELPSPGLPLLCAFLLGGLLAFLAGDLGAWISRRRVREDRREDEWGEQEAGSL